MDRPCRTVILREKPRKNTEQIILRGVFTESRAFALQVFRQYAHNMVGSMPMMQDAPEVLG